MPRIALATMVAAILVGCSSSNPTGAPSPISTSSTVSVPPDATSAASAALADAATRLGVPSDQLHVDQVEPRQWPDSSLGCPQPGQLYSQIVTPGYLVVISGAGQQLEYHTDTRSRVSLCRTS